MSTRKKMTFSFIIINILTVILVGCTIEFPLMNFWFYFIVHMTVSLGLIILVSKLNRIPRLEILWVGSMLLLLIDLSCSLTLYITNKDAECFGYVGLAILAIIIITGIGFYVTNLSNNFMIGGKRRRRKRKKVQYIDEY